jgi:hypothetical protein
MMSALLWLRHATNNAFQQLNVESCAAKGDQAFMQSSLQQLLLTEVVRHSMII